MILVAALQLLEKEKKEVTHFTTGCEVIDQALKGVSIIFALTLLAFTTCKIVGLFQIKSICR